MCTCTCVSQMFTCFVLCWPPSALPVPSTLHVGLSPSFIQNHGGPDVQDGSFRECCGYMVTRQKQPPDKNVLLTKRTLTNKQPTCRLLYHTSRQVEKHLNVTASHVFLFEMYTRSVRIWPIGSSRKTAQRHNANRSGVSAVSCPALRAGRSRPDTSLIASVIARLEGTCAG